MEHKHEHHHHTHEHHHHDHNAHKQIVLICTTAILLFGAVLVEKNTSLATWQLLLVYLIPYLLIGFDTLKEAAEGIAQGDVFNEHFLMSVATIGALCIGFIGGETQFPEAVFVMLFFQVGELFEGYAEGKSRESISKLMDIRPDTAHVERDGQQITLSPDQVSVGETIVVKPGEKVPLDGKIVRGSSALNTVALTGESAPRQVGEGDEVISGCVNLSGLLYVQTTKTFGESTASKIIDLVENANEHKSKSETFIARFAKIYTPIVTATAIALALVPPFFYPNYGQGLALWLYRALMFLVVSCPCALVLSVPLTFFGGIGGASRRGILIKGANHIDTLAKTGIVVFDKTGTLTHGQFSVTATHPAQCDGLHLLHMAAHVERFSNHPIAIALRDAFPNEANDGCSVTDVKEISGHGISAMVGSDHVCVGNAKMMEALGVACDECNLTGTIVHVAINGEYAGHIVIADQIKSDAAEAISQLKRAGIRSTVMLTGDRQAVAKDVALQLQLDEFQAELLPADKVTHVNRLLQQKLAAERLAFVGDGINDAPVLARADVGIAMGGLGSDAAIEAADVVIMDDQPSKVALAIRLARHTMHIAQQNIWFAIGAKVLILILAATGYCTMWLAVFGDVGVTVLAVLNAMRTLK